MRVILSQSVCRRTLGVCGCSILIMSIIIFILSLIICVNAKLNVHIIDKTNATHFTNSSFYPNAVLKAHNRLVHVSFPRINNDTSFKLEWDEDNSCEIFLPQLNYFSTVVQSLGDGKIVIGLVENGRSTLRIINKPNSVNVQFFIVDFANGCEYEMFETRIGKAILDSYESFSIVPYYDSFDIFAKSSSHCEPKDSICLIG